MYNREYNRRLRVGIVGAGSHMYRNLLPAIHHLPMEIAAMASRGQEKLRRTAIEYGCSTYASAKEMYEAEALDAAVISVSPQRHPDLVCEALEHGLHVFVEKPVAMRVEEVERMKNVAQKAGKLVVVGYKKAFMPATAKALEVVANSSFGPLSSILAVYPMSMPANGREVLENRTFTNWLGNGCHPLSFLLAVAGEAASIQTIVNEKGFGSVILQHRNGVMSTLHLADGPQPNEEYHLFGSGWNMKIVNSSHVSLNRGIPFDYAYVNSFAPTGFDSGRIVWEPQNCLATLENKSLFLQGMVQEMKYFCDCVLEGTRPVTGSLDFARQVTALYEAALLSEGAVVTV